MAFKSKYTGKQIENLLDSSTTKQDKLVSGTNIKTINGQSLLGSGDITVQGGESSDNDYDIYPQINHGTSDTIFELTPNTFHVWGEVSSLKLTLSDEIPGITNEYLFQFTSGEEPTTLTLPNNLTIANDTTLLIEPNTVYQISILNKLLTLISFKRNVFIITYYIVTDFTNFQTFTEVNDFNGNMTWEEWVNSEYNTKNYYIDGDNLICREINNQTVNLFDSSTGDYIYGDDFINNTITYSFGDIMSF